jgi:phosphoribosylformylglycinamidine synthase
MIYRVEVTTAPGHRDSRGEALTRQARTLGIAGLEGIAVADIYFLQGDLEKGDVRHLVEELLHDPVVERARWQRWQPGQQAAGDGGSSFVEVALLPGVTDSVAESVREGAAMIGVAGLQQAASGHRYLLYGSITRDDVHRLATGLLANEVIQAFHVGEPVDPPFMRLLDQSTPEQIARAVETIPLRQAGAEELLAISRDRRLSLDLAEMRAIRDYYASEDREPTDVELETLAQTWSEHCVHKTFKARIAYREVQPDGSVHEQEIDSILGHYIRAATERADKPWVRSAFVDNAGIVAFDDRFDLAFKVETHNHPSALEPFGGANTGVGGVVRDVIGVSARPIANTDVLCFGPQELPMAALPPGVLHPQRISDGVIAGIEDYGNKMGIPTVNGAILYDWGYTANPLVFCGCLGILPHGSHRTEPQAGDLVVVMGGRTGRDGLRGATFSSMEMDHETSEVAGSAVQIGHPIHEKMLLEAIMLARDEGLYHAITDCGAGGLSSAVGEMGEALGAKVDLERVPLKYPGLRPWEIWLSEAQERMILAVPPGSWQRLREICAGLDVEATVLGAFTGSGRLEVRYAGRTVGELDCEFLHRGIPRRHLQAEWRPVPLPAPAPGQGRPAGDVAGDLTGVLLALLAMPETRSKEKVVRRYDHEVQGGTVVKPLVGVANHGPGDATVLAPQVASADSRRGVALAVGVNPFYGQLDPYLMAWAAVDEAMRNVVAVGANPGQVALLDNFAWGNPSLPDRLGSLVRCARGCFEAAVSYDAPFISGKDSLNNEYVGRDGQKHAIPGTLVISALGLVPDITRTVTMDLKQPGNWLYAVGLTRGEVGGSSLGRRFPELAAALPGQGPPQVPDASLALYQGLHSAIAQGLVQACHDCSEGGLLVAAAEMALAGGQGLDLDLRLVPRAADVADDLSIAFGETLARLLVEVAPKDAPTFEAILDGLPMARIGEVTAGGRLTATGLAGLPVLEAPIGRLSAAWSDQGDPA